MTATLTQYIDTTGEVEAPWVERTYGQHSDTRYLDEPTVPVWLVLRREGHTGVPRISRKAAR